MAAHAARGQVVMYLTGRPYWLTEMSREWLVTKNFTQGPLRVTDSNTQILPTEGSVGDYKLAQLEALVDAGFIIDAAYGNATTDIYAYLSAGIAADDVWIIGDHASEQGTNGVTGSWSHRAAEVAAMAKVTQPFNWQ